MAADSDAIAILRVCSYHHQGGRLKPVSSRLRKLQDAEKSLQTTFVSPPTSGLGTLDRLPMELVFMVLRHMDLFSFFRFRQANRRARELSTALSDYKLIAKHGLKGFQKLLRCKTGHHISIDDLHRSLITPSCSSCGDFGNFLFLFDATRSCSQCLQNSRKFRFVCVSSLAKFASISRKRLFPLLGSILHAPSLGPCISAMERPEFMVTEQTALETLATHFNLKLDDIRVFLSRYDKSAHRSMAFMAFPWYDQFNDSIEHGLRCRGCEDHPSTSGIGKTDFQRVYSTIGFLNHFSSCPEAKKLWDGVRAKLSSQKSSDIVRE